MSYQNAWAQHAVWSIFLLELKQAAWSIGLQGSTWKGAVKAALGIILSAEVVAVYCRLHMHGRVVQQWLAYLFFLVLQEHVA